MRILSPAAIDASFDDSGNGDIFLACLDIQTPTLEFHIVNNNEQITGKSGTVYEFYPFELMMPNDDKTAVSSVSLKIDNVDRMLVSMLRSETVPPVITLKVIMASTLDDENPEIIVEDLKLRNVSWNAKSITGSLSVDSILNAKYPSNSETYDPLVFPGLF